MSLSPSFPWPTTRSPRHKKSCEAEPCTCWACCARPFVYDNEWGLRTRRKGWPRDAWAELGPGADPGVSDGRKKVAN